MTTVLDYGQDVCQNWRKDALFYGVLTANQNWPQCKNGQLVAPVVAPIQPPPETTGGAGAGSPPASVNVGCGCHKDAGAVTQPAPSGPAPVVGAPAPSKPEPTAGAVLDRLKGLPWWVYLLGILALSQLFNRGGARAG